MAAHSFKTLEGGRVRDQGALREQVWSALIADCARREAEAASREEVLRDLLDDAHLRIRNLETALRRLTAAAIRSGEDDTPERAQPD
jgi:hypothetical protein